MLDIPRGYEDPDDDTESRSYPHDLLTESLLLSFLEKFLSGALAPTVTSEELLPNEAKLSSRPLHKVVASNFDSRSAPPAVLLSPVLQRCQLSTTLPPLHCRSLVCSPPSPPLSPHLCRCGHCKSMEPTIRSLAQHIHHHYVDPATSSSNSDSAPASALTKGLLVGKMDGTKNDFTFPGVVIRGFPTILLFRSLCDGPSLSLTHTLSLTGRAGHGDTSRWRWSLTLASGRQATSSSSWRLRKSGGM
jgi:hypothetical protein